MTRVRVPPVSNLKIPFFRSLVPNQALAKKGILSKITNFILDSKEVAQVFSNLIPYQ